MLLVFLSFTRKVHRNLHAVSAKSLFAEEIISLLRNRDNCKTVMGILQMFYKCRNQKEKLSEINILSRAFDIISKKAYSGKNLSSFFYITQ